MTSISKPRRRGWSTLIGQDAERLLPTSPGMDASLSRQPRRLPTAGSRRPGRLPRRPVGQLVGGTRSLRRTHRHPTWSMSGVQPWWARPCASVPPLCCGTAAGAMAAAPGGGTRSDGCGRRCSALRPRGALGLLCLGVVPSRAQRPRRRIVCRRTGIEPWCSGLFAASSVLGAVGTGFMALTASDDRRGVRPPGPDPERFAVSSLHVAVPDDISGL